MSEINPEIFRNLFKQLKSQKVNECETLVYSELEKGDTFDRAMDERTNELLIKLKSRTSLFIRKIDMAMERIDEGSFGTCEDCEGTISEERLFARPTAQLCINCKEVQESAEKKLLYSKRSHTLGKTLVTDITLDKCDLGVDGGGAIQYKTERLKKAIGI
jgi:DnaK suppressor protein